MRVYLAYSEYEKWKFGGVMIVCDATDGSTHEVTDIVMHLPEPGKQNLGFEIRPPDDKCFKGPFVLEKLICLKYYHMPADDIEKQILINELSKEEIARVREAQKEISPTRVENQAKAAGEALSP